MSHPSISWICLALGTALTPEIPFNFCVGTQTFSPKYQLTAKTRLQETAEQILGLHSNIIKFEMSRRVLGTEKYHLPANPAIKSLADLAKSESSYDAVLHMPFAYYLIWAYPFSTPDHPWQNGLAPEVRAKVYREMYDLTAYLLKTFHGSHKSFLLGHWEGDWALLGETKDPDKDPSPRAIAGMIDWLNVRQKAIEDARRDCRAADVFVYGYTEVNLVQKAMKGRPTVANSVLPKVNVDYASYSCWDALDLSQGTAALAQRLRRSLDYIESKLPPKKGEGKRVFIGEYGFALATVHSSQVQTRASVTVMLTALDWGCPFCLYWQMYENVAREGENGKGFWLINNQGEKSPLCELLQALLADAEQYVRKSQERDGRLPSQREYRQFAKNWLRQHSK